MNNLKKAQIVYGFFDWSFWIIIISIIIFSINGLNTTILLLIFITIVLVCKPLTLKYIKLNESEELKKT